MAGAQTPGPSRQITGLVGYGSGGCACATLQVYSTSGTETGSLALPGGGAPALAAGSGGAYFVSGSLLMRVSAAGQLNQVGTVDQASRVGAGLPPSQLGSLAVAPGGRQWAYLVSVSGGAGTGQEVWVGGAGLRPRLLLDSSQQAAPPASEYPGGWSYALLGWVDGQLLLGLAPVPAAGFAPAYPEVSLVNPETGAGTVVSNSANCAVSAVSAGGEYACLQQGAGLPSELVTGIDGFSSATFALPAGGGYGGASFSPGGGDLVLSLCPGCGPAVGSAYLQSQLQVLDTATGRLTPLGPPGLVADAWLPGGEIVATRYTGPRYDRYGSTISSQLVLVSSGSGAVSALAAGSGAQFVGLTTG